MISRLDWSPAGLAAQIRYADTYSDLLRITGTWMSRARDLDERPAGFDSLSPRSKAWVAATVAATARKRGQGTPSWAAGHALPGLWYPGESRGLFVYAFQHNVPDYLARGIIVAKDSLETV